MTKLTGKEPWVWEREQQEAFQTLKDAITSAPCLQIPNDDGIFRVEADSSDGALGAVVWRPSDRKGTFCGCNVKPASNDGLVRPSDDTVGKVWSTTKKVLRAIYIS